MSSHEPVDEALPRDPSAEIEDEFDPAEGAEPARRLPSLRAYGVALVIVGGVGLLAAFTLLEDKIKILKDPSFRPSCDLNPVLSCGSVMTTDQASAFGFPNPMLGLIGFSVVITLGVLYAVGTTIPRWIRVGLLLGTATGTVFVHWLAFQSLYRIGALCPWCMGVWAVTIFAFVWALALEARYLWPRSKAALLLWDTRFLIVVLWYLAIGLAILVRFWSYWKTQL